MPRKAHYVLSTHWDREWYQSMQDYRYRLVRLIDRILDGWNDGRLKGPFQSDGQMIIWEDYLEIRPERREEVLARLRDGHIVAGPWYVLPDEFLVSGESLIRNIEYGRELVRRWGAEPSNAGFLCDMFGHNSQMPQIFSGFGIPMGFIWRGNNLRDNRLVVWRGADGTELPCYRFGEIGYCTYAIQVRPVQPLQAPLTPEEIAAQQEAYLLKEDAKTETGPLLIFDGGDHLEWDPADYAVLSQRFGVGDEVELQHTSLDSYMKEMLTHRERITALLEGELREPALFPPHEETQWLIPGVGSSRVNLKLANAACQSLLTQWAEPISLLAEQQLGMEYPRGYLETAWRWLIQNHPHDSICGCSIDRVHEDMLYRFHQTEQIAERLTLEATRALTASAPGEIGPNEVRVGVFNPLPRRVDEVVELDLDLPTGWPTFCEMSNSESKIAFRIYDPQGKELPYQRLSQHKGEYRWRMGGKRFADNYQVDRVRVSLPLAVPATGYTMLRVKAGETEVPTRHPMQPGLVTGARSMANEYLFVTVESDGTLTVLDKRTGQTYSGLLAFEDRADIGDGWNHGPAENDQHFVSPGSRVSVARVANGRYKASFRIRVVMDLPAEFDFAAMQRSDAFTGLVIDSLVSLKAGSDHLEVETVVHNTIKDHRLRVLFPSGANAETYLADSPFDVVERPIALRSDRHLYREPEIEPKPMQSFIAVHDRERGLAVISSGLLESGVMDVPERVLALTLFRATRKTVGTNGEPGGQMLGELRFRYWLAPLDGSCDRARLMELGQLLAGGLRCTAIDAPMQSFYRAEGSAAAQAGYLAVEGGAVLTSLRRSAAGVEARLFNPADKTAKASLDMHDWPENLEKPARVTPVNLEHQPVGAPQMIRRGKVEVTLNPKQIITLLIQ